ncbi:TPA: hypothetical protein PIU60_000855 [Klebsiella quasipneumoniae subsp. quasipneumoniae]|nr:hypothetical protein [Klebsiella quasipneumoniae subsp. quasipneumoniae]
MKSLDTLEVGQTAVILTNAGERLEGILVDKSDWSVGCPVVRVGDTLYGIGYQADIITTS